jgi:hypothetical protein
LSKKTLYLFPQRPHGENETHIYLQTTFPISRTKSGKERKAKWASHTSAKKQPKQPHFKKDYYQTGYQTPTNPKCPGDINQDHALNIKAALSHSHVSSITVLLGPSIFWSAQEKTTNRPQSSSKQSDYQAKDQSHC